MSQTVADVVDRTLDAYDSLIGVADAVTDDAQYVADLRIVWRARLTAVATARGSEDVPPATAAAVAAAVAESGSVDDPHRAIDWLSTLPQIVLLGLGEPG